MTSAEIERACRSACIAETIEQLPMGYDTLLASAGGSLSGGQRQRIVIARALALNPSFIVCDESVSALDVSVQAQVLNLLNDLKKEFGFTVVFISHDLSVIRYISDRILVMNKGKIEEIGEAEAIYHHPAAECTRKLIEAIPEMSGEHEQSTEKDQPERPLAEAAAHRLPAGSPSRRRPRFVASGMTRCPARWRRRCR